MNRRRAAGVAGALALAVGLAWALWPETQATKVEASDRPAAPSRPARSRQVVDAPEVTDQSLEAQEAALQRDLEQNFGRVFISVVRETDGQPVAGARVIVDQGGAHRGFYGHHRSRPFASAATDADGNADMVVQRKIEPELQLIASVAADFYEPKFEKFVDGMTVKLVPLPPLLGRVVDAKGQPVAGAQVTTLGSKERTVSDGAGRFQLRPPREDWVVAEKDGHWGHTDWDEAKSKEVLVTLNIEQQKSQVLNRKLEPLARVAIDYALGGIGVHLLSDGEGRFALPKLPGSWKVRFARAGYASVEPELRFDMEVPAVILTRSSRIEGELVTPEGQPVPGATIAATGDELEHRDVEGDTTTGPDGRFVLENIGALKVVLFAQLGERTAEQSIDVPEGGTGRARLVLRPEMGEVELEVVDSRDHPVASYDFEAEAFPIPDQGWTSKSLVGTLELNKGRFRIVVVAGEAKGEVTVDVDPTVETPPIHIKLDGPVDDDLFQDNRPPTHTLKVRVKTTTGAPVENAEVECLYASGQTGVDGVFECKIAPGENDWPIQVRAKKAGESGMTRATSEGDVEVVLRAARTVRGRIDGVIPAGTCTLNVNSSSQNQNYPLEGNHFALEGVGPVRAYVCVMCRPPDDPVARERARTTIEIIRGTVSTTIGCAVAEVGQDEVVIPSGAAGALTLKVLDSTGQPVASPIFYVDRTGTDADAPAGEARLTVPPGTHVLVVNIAGKRERAELPFTIRPGETTALGTVQLK